MTRGHRSPSAAALALGASVLVLFAPGLFFGKVPIFRDLLLLVIPLRTYAARAMASGRIPFWTPDLFFGAPFLANYQSAVLYPPSAILYVLPLAPGLSVFLSFHVFMAGLGMALYLERRRGLEPLPALLGGVVFALGGFVMSLVSLTNQLQVGVWLPWVLDAAEELQQTGKARSFAALTIFLALQALGGAPEAWLISLALVTVNGVRVARLGASPRGRPLLPAAAAMLAAGLAAPQLLSTLEYVRQTDRATALPFATVTAESLTPLSFLQLLLPHRFFDGSAAFVPELTVPLFWSLYLGIAPLVLAVIVAMRPKLRFWSAVLGVSTLLSLGSSTPLFALFYSIAPGIAGAFRFPGKFFLAGHFVLAVLSAEGLAAASTSPAFTRRAQLAAGVVAAAAFSIAVSASVSSERTLLALGYAFPSALAAGAYDFISAQVAGTALHSAMLAVCIIGLLSLLQRGTLAARGVGVGVCLITVIDLVAVHQPALVFTDWKGLARAGDETVASLGGGSRIFHYCTTVPRCLPEGAPGLGSWTGTLPVGENVAERGAQLWRALVFDIPLVYGIGSVDGGDGFSTRDQRQLFLAAQRLPRAAAVQVLAALGVDALIGFEPLDLPNVREVSTPAESGIHVYAVPAAAPRSYLAERVVTALDTDDALAMLGSSEFRPGRDVVVFASKDAIRGSGGQIRDAAFLPESLAATVSVPEPGLWVLADTHFPGWEATVDGEAVEILRVNAIGRGIRVPAGEHRIEMSYRPSWLRWGVRLSTLCAAALLATRVFGR